MPKNSRVSVAVHANEAHWCDVSGCTEHRSYLSRWCTKHTAAADRNGHPTAPAIRASSWAPYRSNVRLMFHENSNHQGLTRALAWIAAWMAEAVEKDGQRRHRWATEVSLVARHGSSPLDVLVELAACWCYLEDHPRVTRSDTHRDWTLSRAVFGLAPRPRKETPAAQAKGTKGYAIKARPAALNHVGAHLRQTLGPLLATTHRSLQTEADRARAEVEAFRVPFNPTNQAIEQAAQAINHQLSP